jgi:hypothetical protein
MRLMPVDPALPWPIAVVLESSEMARLLSQLDTVLDQHPRYDALEFLRDTLLGSFATPQPPPPKPEIREEPPPVILGQGDYVSTWPHGWAPWWTTQELIGGDPAAAIAEGAAGFTPRGCPDGPSVAVAAGAHAGRSAVNGLDAT